MWLTRLSRVQFWRSTAHILSDLSRIRRPPLGNLPHLSQVCLPVGCPTIRSCHFAKLRKGPSKGPPLLPLDCAWPRQLQPWIYAALSPADVRMDLSSHQEALGIPSRLRHHTDALYIVTFLIIIMALAELSITGRELKSDSTTW